MRLTVHEVGSHSFHRLALTKFKRQPLQVPLVQPCVVFFWLIKIVGLEQLVRLELQSDF